MLNTSSGEFHGAGDCFGRIFSAGDFFLDFYGAGDFFGGIFTVLETSSGEFHSAGDFFGGIFKVLETSSGIFMVLGTFGDFRGARDGFWRFSLCWILLWRDFHNAGDFWDFHGAGDFFGGIFKKFYNQNLVPKVN